MSNLPQTPKKPLQPDNITPPKGESKKRDSSTNPESTTVDGSSKRMKHDEENVDTLSCVAEWSPKPIKLNTKSNESVSFTYHPSFEYSNGNQTTIIPITIAKLLHATHCDGNITTFEAFSNMISPDSLTLCGFENKHYKGNKYVWFGICSEERKVESCRYGYLLFEVDVAFLAELKVKYFSLGTRVFKREHSHTMMAVPNFEQKSIQFSDENGERMIEEDRSTIAVNTSCQLLWNALAEPQLVEIKHDKFDHLEIAVMSDTLSIPFEKLRIRFVNHGFCYHNLTKGKKEGFVNCNETTKKERMIGFFNNLAKNIEHFPKALGKCFYEDDWNEVKNELGEENKRIIAEHFEWN